MSCKKTLCIVVLFLTVLNTAVIAQKDTLRVMAYNVLYYGNGCQGPNYQYHNYLKTIVNYTNPDIVSLEKMAAIPTSASDKYATAPTGFADSIIRYGLNAAFPGRYAYCPFSNKAKGNNIAVVFYDQHKLGFAGVVSSYVNITDFNTYKLYYKDPNLPKTHDTVFLYVTANHDRSGDENENVRAIQINGVLNNIKQHFSRLPNFIDLGDFNSRGSREPFYQTLVAPADTNFRFFDPPFYPDKKLSYPSDWDHDSLFAPYFTTSTRELKSVPNSCGTDGGAKGWYDHIFLSSWIINNANRMRYIPNSYRTIGNDGQRFKVSVNDKGPHINRTTPGAVSEALFQMSNKYPVMADIEVDLNGKVMSNPGIAGSHDLPIEEVFIEKIVKEEIILHCPEDRLGQAITVEVLDEANRSQMKVKTKITGVLTKINCKLKAGSYLVKVTGHHNIIAEEKVIKK